MINPCSFALCGAFLLFIYLSSLIVGWVTATARAASYLEPVTVSSPHPPPPSKVRFANCWLGHRNGTWRRLLRARNSFLPPPPPPPHKRDRPHHTLRTVRGFFRRLMSHRMGTALLMKNLQPGTLES